MSRSIGSSSQAAKRSFSNLEAPIVLSYRIAPRTGYCPSFYRRFAGERWLDKIAQVWSESFMVFSALTAGISSQLTHMKWIHLN